VFCRDGGIRAANNAGDVVEDTLAAARRDGRISHASVDSYRRRLLVASGEDRSRLLGEITAGARGQFNPEWVNEPAPIAAAAALRASGAGARLGASHAVAASLRAQPSSGFVKASASGVVIPKAFGSSDIPPMTVSGADPNLLSLLPRQARWAGAKASRQELAGMITEYQGAFGDDLAAVHAMGGGPFYSDVQAYSAEVSHWLVGAYEPGYNGPIFS